MQGGTVPLNLHQPKNNSYPELANSPLFEQISGNNKNANHKRVCKISNPQMYILIIRLL